MSHFTPETVSPSLIEFRNVTVIRGRAKALDGLSLSISLGEHVAIVGPNGCGKSTLIKTIARECHPLVKNSGSMVRILGQERWNIFKLRPQLGIVSPDWVNLCTRPITGKEAVLSGFFSSTEIWPHNQVTPEMERKAEEVLELLEIEHLAGQDMTEMSTGETRRIVIGRALVHDPRALILDEPTASLDLRAVAELREIMRKIAQAGACIVLVTHHLPDIIPEIERVILMKAGKIFRDGPKGQMLKSSALSELFEMPLQVIEKDGCYHLL
jgi:iron complex transport system ATP-binding protein